MTETQRIGFLIGTLDVGGTEKQLVQICQHLDQARFSSEVMCMVRKGELAAGLERHGVPVTAFGITGFRASPWAGWKAVLRMARYARSRRFSVLVGVLPHAVILGALVSRLAGIPRYYSLRRSVAAFPDCAHSGFRSLLRFSNCFTDLIIANSMAVKKSVMQGELIPEGRVQVIYNGVDSQAFAGFDKAAMRQAMGIPAGKTVVAVLANFIAYKGHGMFLEAWKRVSTEIPDALALFIGDGPTFPEIREKAVAMGLERTIQFTGTRLDIPEMLSTIDILVHPSREEGFSNAVLEGMAAGKPVIATAVGGIPEALESEEAGVLIPPDDPGALAGEMLRLMTNPELASRMGKQGQRRVTEEFPFSRMVERYETLFEAGKLG